MRIRYVRAGADRFLPYATRATTHLCKRSTLARNGQPEPGPQDTAATRISSNGSQARRLGLRFSTVGQAEEPACRTAHGRQASRATIMEA